MANAPPMRLPCRTQCTRSSDSAAVSRRQRPVDPKQRVHEPSQRRHARDPGGRVTSVTTPVGTTPRRTVAIWMLMNANGVDVHEGGPTVTRRSAPAIGPQLHLTPTVRVGQYDPLHVVLQSQSTNASGVRIRFQGFQRTGNLLDTVLWYSVTVFNVNRKSWRCMTEAMNARQPCSAAPGGKNALLVHGQTGEYVSENDEDVQAFQISGARLHATMQLWFRARGPGQFFLCQPCCIFTHLLLPFRPEFIHDFVDTMVGFQAPMCS